jgi:uncharacterized protein YndB with AHSA1/START domain
MPRNDHSIEINRPAEEVFRLLLDVEERRRWDEGLLEGEALTEGEIDVGHEFRDTYETRGGTITLRGEIMAYAPNEHIEVKLYTDGGFQTTATYDLEETEDRTLLTYRSQSHYYHPLARLLSPIVTRMAQKKLREDFARLKELAESR